MEVLYEEGECSSEAYWTDTELFNSKHFTSLSYRQSTYTNNFIKVCVVYILLHINFILVDAVKSNIACNRACVGEEQCAFACKERHFLSPFFQLDSCLVYRKLCTSTIMFAHFVAWKKDEYCKRYSGPCEKKTGTAVTFKKTKGR